MQELILPARVLFSKMGRARYISHLDTMRTFTRALRRSGLPLWYTQGFNPHLYLTFPLPLSLGVESGCEPLDFRLTQELPFEEVAARMAQSLPSGFGVVSAAAPQMQPGDIAWAEYDILMRYPPQEREAVLFAVKNAFAKPAMEVCKRSKKGDKIVDIRPHTVPLFCEQDPQGIRLGLRLAAGSTLNINPALVLDVLADAARAPDGTKILRTKILNQNREEFA